MHDFRALKGGIESSVAARTALGLPTDYVPVVAIAIGHPAHELKPRHFVTDRLRTITLTPDQPKKRGPITTGKIRPGDWRSLLI